MFKSGQFVAEQLGELGPAQLQPNGVDLTIADVFEQVGTGRIEQSGTTIGDRRAVSPTDGLYRLASGAYIIQYAERVTIPEDHVGYIHPRSSLLRNSCMLETAVWDAGYEGRGEGLLEVYAEIELEPGARIGQLVLAQAANESTYDGQYQGERIE